MNYICVGGESAYEGVGWGWSSYEGVTSGPVSAVITLIFSIIILIYNFIFHSSLTEY